MNVEELVRAALREQAADTVPAPGDFAGRVLTGRRRRTRRTVSGVAAATVLVVAVAVGVPVALNSADSSPALASAASDGKTLARPDQSPPRDLIAAGGQALAAYYTSRKVKQPNRDEIVTRTYSLLDQKTGTYEVDARWAYVDIAPGMRTAAVLERQLPVKRIGVLDLRTGEVTRWIPVRDTKGGVGAVDFSPDGRSLVATTYGKNPDRHFWSNRAEINDGDKTRSEPRPVYSRTGFSLIDFKTGQQSWNEVPPFRMPGKERDIGAGEMVRFNTNGTLAYETIHGESGPIFRDLGGKVVMPPLTERPISPVMAPAGLSPNGRLVAGPGGLPATATEVVDPTTGKRTRLKVQELLAWADDKRLIAWDIAPGGDKSASRLVLITIGSDKVVPLSGARSPEDYSPGRWEPIFAKR